MSCMKWLQTCLNCMEWLQACLNCMKCLQICVSCMESLQACVSCSRPPCAVWSGYRWPVWVSSVSPGEHHLFSVQSRLQVGVTRASRTVGAARPGPIRVLLSCHCSATNKMSLGLAAINPRTGGGLGHLRTDGRRITTPVYLENHATQ